MERASSEQSRAAQPSRSGAATADAFTRFQRLLVPEPAAMFQLPNRPPAWMDRAVVQAFRQFTEEFSVVLNDLSGLIGRISLPREEIGARQLEQSNHTLYTLTVITVLALPINIVAGFASA
ncbi:hypothetical protein MJ588_13390 [Klebsiella pneumoniae]|nr:hypothetical protein MJ588_13390 [Klebsiella pneumoniae]